MPLEINRDSVFIVVKDDNRKVKELIPGEDDILISAYASPQYIAHIASKNDNGLILQPSKYNDPLLQSSLANKPDYSNYQMPKEVGIKINVG